MYSLHAKLRLFSRKHPTWYLTRVGDSLGIAAWILDLVGPYLVPRIAILWGHRVGVSPSYDVVLGLHRMNLRSQTEACLLSKCSIAQAVNSSHHSLKETKVSEI